MTTLNERIDKLRGEAKELGVELEIPEHIHRVDPRSQSIAIHKIRMDIEKALHERAE